MHQILPKSLFPLAKSLPSPLFVVGGAVRDFLAGFSCERPDWDICAPLSADEFAQAAQSHGFSVKAVYRNTGTVKLSDADGVTFEYACFRSDKYVRGVHVPTEIFFTDDVVLDAKRRDFTANAVYYNIEKQTFVDPLNGIEAIREKRLSTVAPAQKVFSEDGLRLLRLARQAAQLGFTPDEECKRGATENAALIADISPERIFTELELLLLADEKFGVTGGAYNGLKLLEEIGVLAKILPELTQGKGMKQRADFHNHDVLEHSLRAVKYAPPSIRLAALLHDVGKPFCTLRDGNTHKHPIEGEILAKAILCRLKAPKKTTERVCELIRWHMYDLDGKTSEKKLRKFFVQNKHILEELLLLKQADFSACKDNLNPAPTCVRWHVLLEKMQKENTPFTLRQLAVNGKDLLALNIPPAHVSTLLQALLMHTAIFPSDNEKYRLLSLVLGMEKDLI